MCRAVSRLLQLLGDADVMVVVYDSAPVRGFTRAVAGNIPRVRTSEHLEALVRLLL